jgi:hypothetical protein
MGDDATFEVSKDLVSLTAPSITAVGVTFAAMERSVDAISADCRAVSETLQVLNDALAVIDRGSGPGSDWGGFGVIGLPIAGAVRALKGVVSQQVRQKTGVPLTAWTDHVASYSTQFSEYVAELDTVTHLAEQYRGLTEEYHDLQQAQMDLEKLLDIRWRTKAWKQILSHVAQLGQLVEALSEVDIGGDLLESTESGAPERTSAFSGSLQRRLKEVQSRTGEKSSGIGEWVLKPFVDAADRVRALPQQVNHLSHEVTLLEVLLDLEIAVIRAYLGQISPPEASIVGIRVAVGVILPKLAEDLADARQGVAGYETYLERLAGARSAGDVDDRAYSILSEEYRDGLEKCRARLDELEAQAAMWRREGPSVLDECSDWTNLQLEVLAIRKAVERDVAVDDRGYLLQRERERLNETRSVLASL